MGMVTSTVTKKTVRIVWKDSAVTRSDFKYRGYCIEGCKNGWAINISRDNNVYRTNKCAKNAIDKALGLEGRKHKKLPKRLTDGINIIGTKNDESKEKSDEIVEEMFYFPFPLY